MARIEGIDLPNQKRVVIGLTYIYGIGHKTANDIVAKAGIPLTKRVHELTEDEIAAFHESIKFADSVPRQLLSRTIVARNFEVTSNWRTAAL